MSNPVRTRHRPRVVDDVGVSPWLRSPVRRQARHDEEDLDRAAVVAAETAVAQSRADLDARAAVGAAFDACDEADAALAVYALCVATSGTASALLIKASTRHGRFKVPVSNLRDTAHLYVSCISAPRID